MENVVSWHRNVLLHFQQCQYVNCEELATSMIFSLLADKHLLVSVDDQIYSEPASVDQLLFTIDGVFQGLMGYSAVINTIETFGHQISDLFFERDEGSLKRMDKFGIKSRQTVTTSSQLETESFTHQQSLSGAGSTSRRNSSNNFSGSFAKNVHRPSFSSTAAPRPVHLRKVAQGLILHMPNPAFYPLLDQICPILIGKQVNDGKNIHVLNKVFLMVLVVPSSAARLISRFCCDHLFYQVVIAPEKIPSMPIGSPGAGGKTADDALFDPDTRSELKDLMSKVHISPPIKKFMRDYTFAIRRNPSLVGGLSLKACVDFERAARICAMMIFGAETVMPEHLQLVAANCLGHRVRLKHTLFKKHDPSVIDWAAIAPTLQEIFVIVPKFF